MCLGLISRPAVAIEHFVVSCVPFLFTMLKPWSIRRYHMLSNWKLDELKSKICILLDKHQTTKH